MKTIEWLKQYGFIVVIGLLLLNFLQLCSTRGLVKENKQIEAKIKRIDSVINSNNIFILEQDELSIMLEINGYLISKRVLYDNNAIVRQVTRPDDQMNIYDQKLDSLRKILMKKKYGK